jgi:DNA-binding PadR family transcriptional regulator
MLGELEQVVLLAILRTETDAYGVSIAAEIERQTGRDLTLATIYKTLSRLEQKGLVTARTGEPTPQRGGRRKRYFTLTAAGSRDLRQTLAALERMTRGLAPGWDAPRVIP